MPKKEITKSANELDIKLNMYIKTNIVISITNILIDKMNNDLE
jgi:hypothetical protein